MTIIEHEVMAGLVTAVQDGPLAVLLRYDTQDPLAVRFVFTSTPTVEGRQDITWVFARELLSAGIHAPAGIGDVRLSPTSWQTTSIELRSPAGSCTVWFYTDELREFLQQTTAVLPAGSEACGEDLERTLQEFLRSV